MASIAPDISAVAAASDDRVNLIGLSRAELESVITGFGLPTFRARQIWHWLYHRGATDFEQMTTLAKKARAELKASLTIGRPRRSWLRLRPSASSTGRGGMRTCAGGSRGCKARVCFARV